MAASWLARLAAFMRSVVIWYKVYKKILTEYRYMESDQTVVENLYYDLDCTEVFAFLDMARSWLRKAVTYRTAFTHSQNKTCSAILLRRSR